MEMSDWSSDVCSSDLPHNFRPVFTNEQLASSLQATVLYTLVLRATTIMDLETLHSNIRSMLHSDPAISEQLSNPTLRWTIDPTGLLRLDNRIYVPDSKNLRLRVLQYKHDYPISGHFRHNRTLDLIRREFIWPDLRNSVKSYIKSCTTCMRSKSQRHRPYGLLKQLLVPEFRSPILGLLFPSPRSQPCVVPCRYKSEPPMYYKTQFEYRLSYPPKSCPLITTCHLISSAQLHPLL